MNDSVYRLRPTSFPLVVDVLNGTVLLGTVL